MQVSSAVMRLASAAAAGKNAALLAMGRAGSGKSYTLGGPPSAAGSPAGVGGPHFQGNQGLSAPPDSPRPSDGAQIPHRFDRENTGSDSGRTASDLEKPCRSNLMQRLLECQLQFRATSRPGALPLTL